MNIISAKYSKLTLYVYSVWLDGVMLGFGFYYYPKI